MVLLIIGYFLFSCGVSELSSMGYCEVSGYLHLVVVV